MLPEGWDQDLLGSISEPITSGSRGWAAYYSEQGCPFIRITNLRRESILPDYGNLKYVRLPSGSQEGQRTRLCKGDILVSITADLGIVGYIEEEPTAPSYINQHIARVRIKSGKAISKFVAYQLASDRHCKVIQRLNDAGAKSGLNLPTIASIPIVLPPLPEQRRIAAVLDAWDDAIATAEQLVEATRRRQAALAHRLMMRATNIDIPIGEAFYINAKSLGARTSADYRFEYFPIGNDDGNGGWLEFGSAPSRARRIAEEGDVIYSTVRPLLRRLLRAPAHPAAVYSTGYAVLHPREGNDAGFLFHCMTSPGFESQILARLTGSNYPAIGANDLAELTIPAVGYDEQREIVTVLDHAASTSAANCFLLDQLRHQKRGLMQQLLTGRLRVPESIDVLLPSAPALEQVA